MLREKYDIERYKKKKERKETRKLFLISFAKHRLEKGTRKQSTEKTLSVNFIIRISRIRSRG